MKRCVCVLAALALMLALTVSACAECNFSDVPESHVYYDAIEYVLEKNISNGTADGRFLPDENISVKALCTFCVRAFLPDITRSGRSDVEILADMNVLPAKYRESQLGSISFEDGLLIIGRAAGVLPVTDLELYSSRDVFAYVRDVGQELGVLAIRDKISTENMTRGEAAYVIHSLTRWLESDEIRDLDRVEKYGFGYIDITAVEKYEHLIPELSASLLNVPFATLQVFHDEGYRVCADDTRIEQYGKEHNMGTVVALFSKSNKTIWTKVGHSLPHEMGHFTQSVIMNDKASIDACYAAEKNNLKDSLSSYAGTNSQEYFAEFYGVYVSNSENPEVLAELASAMPKTFNYFEKLNEANWRTEHSEIDANRLEAPALAIY